MKSKYYEIFGLTEAATKTEVKRAYRKLAMKFHPDRNDDPRAHKLFLDLTEAYQILMDDKPVVQHVITGGRREKSEEERIREAQERLRQQSNRIRLQQEYYFRKMTSGFRWRCFSITVFFSTWLAIVMLAEPALPRHFEKHAIVAFSRPYNGLENKDIRYLKTDKGLSLFVASPHGDILHYNPEVVIERSFILRNPRRLWYQTIFYTKGFPVDFSVANLYPLFPLFLLIPWFTFRYRRKSYFFFMFYYFSQYVVGTLAFYILFTQDRWLHLLTFGIF